MCFFCHYPFNLYEFYIPPFLREAKNSIATTIDIFLYILFHFIPPHTIYFSASFIVFTAKTILEKKIKNTEIIMIAIL